MQETNREVTNIEIKNIKKKMLLIGWIGVVIGILLIMWITLIPNIPHPIEIDIILSASAFGGGWIVVIITIILIQSFLWRKK